MTIHVIANHGKSYNGLTSYFCLMSLTQTVVHCKLPECSTRTQKRTKCCSNQLAYSNRSDFPLEVSLAALFSVVTQRSCCVTTLKATARETNFPLDFNSCKIFQTEKFICEKIKLYIVLSISSGKYVYIETSSPRVQGDNAILVRSGLSFSPKKCLSFYYHMYGSSMGTLNVRVGNSTIFTKSGNQENKWIKASVEINNPDPGASTVSVNGS